MFLTLGYDPPPPPAFWVAERSDELGGMLDRPETVRRAEETETQDTERTGHACAHRRDTRGTNNRAHTRKRASVTRTAGDTPGPRESIRGSRGMSKRKDSASTRRPKIRTIAATSFRDVNTRSPSPLRPGRLGLVTHHVPCHSPPCAARRSTHARTIAHACARRATPSELSNDKQGLNAQNRAEIGP